VQVGQVPCQKYLQEQRFAYWTKIRWVTLASWRRQSVNWHEYIFLEIWFMGRGKHSVENERCFFTLIFVKSKLRNMLTNAPRACCENVCTNVFYSPSRLMLQSYLGMWRRIVHWMFSSLHLFSRFKLPWIYFVVFTTWLQVLYVMLWFHLFLVGKNFPTAAARVHGDQVSIPLVKPRSRKRILFLLMSFFLFGTSSSCVVYKGI
jgi:hypothetical protein